MNINESKKVGLMDSHIKDNEDDISNNGRLKTTSHKNSPNK